MNAASMSIEQQAKISRINGNVQLIRDGFFLPAQVGMVLLPGDRVLSDAAGKAVIEFTGVKDALVIENAAAATFNLEVVETDQPPQWIATNLLGEGVYFDSQQATGKTVGTTNNPDQTGYPVLESLVFLGATAAIYSDNEDNTDQGNSIATNELGTDNGNGPETNPDTAEPQPNPDYPNPEPTPENSTGPLDIVLDPLSSSLESLLLNLDTPSPVGSLQANNTQLTPTSIHSAQIPTAN